MKVTMVCDLQYGSTGKGMVSGYLSEREGFDAAISANMPNAGHTAFDHEGNKFVHKVLPSGIFSPTLRKVMIGPGAVFNPGQLHREIEFARECGWLHDVEILIHQNSVPLTPEMKENEANSAVAKIASTAQGSMFAQFEKMMRDPTKKVISRDAYTPAHDGVRVIGNKEWMLALKDSQNIISEGSQGFSLGISQDFYPYCTSRDCTPARFLADMAIPHGALSTVVGVARAFPIRVGSTAAGNSGDFYPDQTELTWEEVNQTPETTTVTGRIRRVFSFSLEQLSESLFWCQPDHVFLNFANYLEPEAREDFFASIQKVCDESQKSRLRYLGYGPYSTDVVDLGQ